MKAEKQTVAGRPGRWGRSDRVLLTLVVPTRDEADNVPTLVHELRESLSDLDYRVVFVDVSTDGTTGMELFSGGSKYTCVMDADLQHPPGKVREMLEIARRSGADVVVASRYGPGGGYAGLTGR